MTLILLNTTTHLTVPNTVIQLNILKTTFVSVICVQIGNFYIINRDSDNLL